MSAVPAPAMPPEEKSPQELAEEREEKAKTRQDIVAGVTLAVFAAVLAICDLGAGKYGDDEILVANEKAAAYSWFQSKSVKQTLVEGESSMLKALVDAGAIDNGKIHAVREHIGKLDGKAAVYEKQKNEILLGSKAVGQDKWAQDVEGEMGKIVGAKEWEVKGEALGKSGDVFDMGTLFLQLCLVLGAIGIVMQGLVAKRVFWGAMIVLGLVGGWYTWAAYGLAWAVPA
jgi:hypothetical protein